MLNRELATTNKRQCATIEESSFEVALSGTKFDTCSEADLKKTMLYIYMLIGLRPHNYPQSPEKEFLHEYIRKYYGMHTCEELALAFEMAVQGKLSIPTNEVNCYEHFSPQYFGRIMSAFRSWARDVHKEIDSKKGPPPLTNYQRLEAMYWNAVYRDSLLKPPLKPAAHDRKMERRGLEETPTENQ